MGFNEDLAALLEANTTFQLGEGEGGNSIIGSFTGANIDDFIDTTGGAFGNFVLDTQTGEVITLAEAMRRDPAAFSTSDLLRDRAAGIPDDRLAAAVGASPQNEPGPGMLSRIIGGVRDGKDLIGLAVTGALGVAGLVMAAQGMTRSSDGSASVALPGGRTVSLSPQETQLLDLAVRQAQAQSNISDKTLGAVSDAATAAAPDITTTLATGAKTAAAQAGAQGQMTGVVNDALFQTPEASAEQAAIEYAAKAWPNYFPGGAAHPEAAQRWAELPQYLKDDAMGTVSAGGGPGGAAGQIIRGDLANERALQGVQTSAIGNLNNLIDVDPTPAQQLGTKVGMAADTEALRLAEGGALDPSLEDLRPLGTAARNTVGSYITGVSTVPGMYGAEDDIRTAANTRLRAGIDATEAVNPAIKRQIAERLDAIQRQMLRDVGPGWEASTPGQRALNDFETWKAELVHGSNLAETSAMSSLALPRAQFLEGVQGGRASAAAPFVTGVPDLLNRVRMGNLSTYAGVGTSARAFDEGVSQNRFARNAAVAGDVGRGTSAVTRTFAAGQAGAPSSSGAVATMLGEKPGALAAGTFGNLASVANFQEGTANQNAITQALLEAQRKRDLQMGGGQLIGQAVSPFITSAAKSLFV